MPDHLTTIQPSRVGVIFVVLVVVGVSALGAWYGAGMQLGDLFAEVTSTSDPQAAEIAESAIDYAPANPRGYWLAGSVLKSAFDDQSVSAAVEKYEAAARVAPHRYSSWIELGRAYELAGSYEKAERALLHAVDLAPEYALPRWHIANFYLRRGRLEDSVRELRKAALHKSPYRVHVFALAWNVLGNDPRQVEQVAADDPESKATLAYFFGSVNRPDDALRIWNTIDPEVRGRFKWQPLTLARDLYAFRSFRGALEFSRLTGADPDARPEAITNGDFESAVRSSESVRFDWRVYRPDGKIDVAIDSSTQQSGKRSLRFTLRGFSKPNFHALTQSVAVMPGASYRLSFWLRTEDLRSGSMPLFEVRNASDDSINAVSSSFPSGTNPWQKLSVEFTVPDTSDGVFLLPGREPCPGECPISGIFWLDSFELSRLQ